MSAVSEQSEAHLLGQATFSDTTLMDLTCLWETHDGKVPTGPVPSQLSSEKADTGEGHQALVALCPEQTDLHLQPVTALTANDEHPAGELKLQAAK